MNLRKGVARREQHREIFYPEASQVRESTEQPTEKYRLEPLQCEEEFMGTKQLTGIVSDTGGTSMLTLSKWKQAA